MLYPLVLLFHPLELHKVNLFLLPYKSSQSPLKFKLSIPSCFGLSCSDPFQPSLTTCLPPRTRFPEPKARQPGDVLGTREGCPPGVLTWD